MKKTCEQWTEIRLPSATIWRENFSDGGRAEYYPKRDGAFGSAIAFLERTISNKGLRKWSAMCRNSDGAFESFLFAKREEAEEKIIAEITRLHGDGHAERESWMRIKFRRRPRPAEGL